MIPHPLKSAIHKYRHQGTGELHLAVARYLRRNSPTRTWNTLIENPLEMADNIIEVGNKQSLDLDYSGNSPTQLPDVFKQHGGGMEGPEEVVCIYEDAEVIGYNPVVKSKHGTIMPADVGCDFSYDASYLRMHGNVPISYLWKDRFAIDSQPARELDKAFLLNGTRGTHYPDWLYEILPKFRWYERYCQITGENPQLISNSPLAGWQTRSLELMGYDPSKILQQDMKPTLVNKLILPVHPRRATNSDFFAIPNHLDWVNKRILSNHENTNASYSSRIFVSRADARTRRVNNRSEMLAMLRKCGFEAYTPGEYSIDEQIQMFSNADAIIGTTGAGLSNMVFSSDGSLIELIPKGGAREHWYVLSNERGIDYDFILCDSIEDSAERPIQRDIVVDVNTLRQKINTIL